MSESELRRLEAAAPAQARGLLATEGYMNPEITVRREPGAVGDLPHVHIEVNPGPASRIDKVELELQGGPILQRRSDSIHRPIQRVGTLRVSHGFDAKQIKRPGLWIIHLIQA